MGALPFIGSANGEVAFGCSLIYKHLFITFVDRLLIFTSLKY